MAFREKGKTVQVKQFTAIYNMKYRFRGSSSKKKKRSETINGYLQNQVPLQIVLRKNEKTVFARKYSTTHVRSIVNKVLALGDDFGKPCRDQQGFGPRKYLLDLQIRFRILYLSTQQELANSWQVQKLSILAYQLVYKLHIGSTEQWLASLASLHLIL